MKTYTYLIQDQVTGKYFSKGKHWVDSDSAEIAIYKS